MYPTLFDQENNLVQPFLQLLEICEIEHEYTLDSIVDATQKAWFQEGKERWAFEERFEEERKEILPLLDELCVLQEIRPDQKYYDYVFVHGGFYKRVLSRFKYLVYLYAEGIKFDQIIVLSGQRILDLQLEQEILNTKTEIAMMKMLAKEISPLEISMGFISVINAEAKRPTTADTIIQWLKMRPIPGKCLAISNQPFIGHQNAVLRTFLPDGFFLQTVGEHADKDTSISVHLDNLAKWLYQERIYRAFSSDS